MYRWIWGHLPGPAALRLFLSLSIIAAGVVVLFGFVFPVVDSWLPLDESEIGSDAGNGSASTGVGSNGAPD